MCFEYDGYTEFASDAVRTARKTQKCSECGAAILPGTKYHYYTGKFDGSFFVEKVCRRCEFDRNRVVEEELKEGCGWEEAWPPFGMLVEHLQLSGLGQTPPEDVPSTFRVGDQPRVPQKA